MRQFHVTSGFGRTDRSMREAQRTDDNGSRGRHGVGKRANDEATDRTTTTRVPRGRDKAPVFCGDRRRRRPWKLKEVHGRGPGNKRGTTKIESISATDRTTTTKGRGSQKSPGRGDPGRRRSIHFSPTKTSRSGRRDVRWWGRDDALRDQGIEEVPANFVSCHILRHFRL